MRVLYIGAIVGLTVAVGACGGESRTGELRGGERLAWDQSAGTQQELSVLRFTLWVDDVAQQMSGISCGPLSTGLTSSCSGVLPAMSPGQHTLALSAMGPDGSQSPRSASLQITVASTTATGLASPAVSRNVSSPPMAEPRSAEPLSADTPAAEDLVSSAGESSNGTLAAVDIQTLAGDLFEPTDLAATRDGRVFVAERRGVIRVLVGGVLHPVPVLSLEDVSTDQGSGLLSLALDPDYERTGLAYVGYATQEGFRIARYRDVAGAFGERAILFETAPDRPYKNAVVRFGPDRQLYVALDDEEDEMRAGDLGSFSGKVLRLNTDGSVPSDQAGFTPVYVPNLGAPRGLDWAPDGRSLWIAEGRLESASTLNAISDESAPSRRRGKRAAVVTRYMLPQGDVPSSVLFYRGERFSEWTGHLLLGLARSGQLLRLRLDPAGPTRVTSMEVVMDGSAGSIRALAVDGEGTLYIASDRALLSVSPAALIPAP